MKKIFLGLLALGTLALGSCYEDKGNYSYNFDSINSVDTISFTPEAYSSFSGWTIDYIKSGEADTITERVTVNPTFSSPEQAGEMDYYWYRRYTWNGTNMSDTLNTPGYMDVLIPNNGDVTYNVILEIRDRITDISYFTNLTVRTREWYTNSLFVLHGNSATNMRLGNVEILGEEPTITLDAFERVNTDPTLHEPFRNARVLGFRLNLIEQSSELVVFKTDATAEVYNPFGLKRLHDTYFVMPPVSSTANLFVPRSMINLCPSSGSQRFRAVVSNDGRFYISSDFFRFYEPGADTDNANHLTTDQYQVRVGTMTSECYVFWDEQNGRFIHNSLGGNNFPYSEDAAREDAVLSVPVLDSHVSSDILKALQGMQPVYAYVNNFGYYQSANEARFIFYDPATQRNLMCSLVQSDGKGGKSAKADEPDASSPFEADTISMPNIHLEPGTPVVYQGAYSLDFIFYADGSTVYRYNIQNGDQEIIYEAPAGYDISILKFKQNEDYDYWGNLYRYLNIGMNRGSEGAVAEIKLTAAGDVDTEYEQQLYEGFDNIVDLQFCNEVQYNVE